MLVFWLCSLTAWAQRTVTGRVTSNEDGSGLPGVNVVLKGTTVGTATNIDGNYTLAVPDDPNAVIVFSSIGFKSQERVIGTASSFDIVLEIDVAKLDEAVVIGYGSVSRKDLTGSVASVSSKDFQTGVLASPEQQIAGKMAGVQITPSTGQPGGRATIRIRGGSSLTASNDPLYVIDGVPIDNGDIAGVGNPLAMINPNDIETFTILKDASATAIYGSRASNGVVLITTKKGTINSKPKFSFSSTNAVSTLVKKASILSADQFRKYITDSGTTQQQGLLGDRNTDWQKQIYQQAYSSDNNLSVAGGLKNMPYRASVGFFSQKGILKTDQIQRASAALNLTPTFFQGHLKANLNLKGSRSESRFADQGAIGNAARFDPTQPIYADTSNSSNPSRYGGFFEYTNAGTGLPNNLSPRNPLGLLMQRDNRSVTQRSIGNIQLDYAFHGLPELRANLNVGYDISDGRGTDKITDSAASAYLPGGKGGQKNEYHQRKQNAVYEAYLAYTKDIASINSRVDVVAGYAYQDFLAINYNFRSLNYQGDTVKGRPKPAFPDDKPRNRLQSYYARVNYSYKDKYLLTATVRQDESSRFAPGNRKGLFPSGALSWRVIEEPWMKKQNVVTDLKARLSYGLTGQQDIGSNYGYQAVYALSNLQAQYQLGNNYYQMYRPLAYDPNLKWESTETYNAGLDFGLIKGRLTGSVDYYVRKTYNLLNTTVIPIGTNFNDVLLRNVGNLENRGVEVMLNGRILDKKDLTWDLGFNVTVNKNKITKLTANSDSSFLGNPVGGIDGGVGSTIQINTVGYPANSFYTYQQKYSDDGKPLEGQFVDRNGDGVITEADRYHNKQAAPKFYYGINSNVSYKKFSLSFVMRGSVGNNVYNNLSSNLGTYRAVTVQPGFLANAHPSLLDYGFTGTKDATKQIQSDLYVQDASFLRMDNLSLAYNVGDIVPNHLSMRVNFTVQNVFVITKYKGIDPEIASGIDNNFYPRPRTYVLGLSFNFN
ncbi:TonB-dependent receptor [Nostoc sp. NIES-2111]